MDNDIKNLLREGINLAEKTKNIIEDPTEDNQEDLNEINEYIITQNGSVDINVSRDKLKVYINIYPALGKGKFVDLDKIKDILKKHNISYGIQWDEITKALEECIKTKKSVKNILIAKGIGAYKGKPEQYRLFYKEKYMNKQLKKLNTKKDDRINYREKNTIQSVQAGEKIIEVIPGENPEPGIDVTGKKININPIDQKKMSPGVNVKFIEKEMCFVAECEGRVNIDSNNVISIFPELIIDGDYDMNIGNLTFDGSLIIHGNINEGFEINVKGDIHVDGNIYSSNITCGGSIIVLKGIITKEKYKVYAENNINAKFIENSYISAGQDITVSKAIIRSTIIAGNKVIASGDKGQIVGSNVFAFKSIECIEAGSSMGTTTTLNAGIDHTKYNLYKEKMSQINELRDMNAKISDYLKKIINKYPDISQMEQEVKKMTNMLNKKNTKILSKIESIKDELIDLENNIYNYDGISEIKITKDLFPGTIINIGKAKLFNNKKSLGARFIWDKALNKIQLTSL